MADISLRITKKSLKAKRKAAIKTIKAQTKEKIRAIKMEYAVNSERKKIKVAERAQKKELRIQKANARLAYNERQPRQYTLGEELFNSISHGIGAGLSAAGNGRSKGWCGKCLVQQSAITEAALHLGLVLANLTIQLFNNQVDGGIHIVSNLLAPQEHTLYRYSYFNLLTVLGNTEENRNLANFLEVAGYFADSLLHIVSKCRSDFYIFSSNSECCHK